MLRDINIVFLDIPTAIQGPTSPNTWKVRCAPKICLLHVIDSLMHKRRLALNYKKIPYTTEWVPTADIKSTCIKYGIPPSGTRPNGEPHYTLPALIDHTNPDYPVILSDSIPIIEYLEKTYPSPPERRLLPDGTTPLQLLFTEFVLPKILSFVPSLAIMAFYRSKTPRDQADFRSRTEAAYGKKLEEIEKQGPEREAAYKESEELFGKLVTAWRKNENHPFIMGERPTLADLAVAAILIFFKLISPNELWVRVSGWDDAFWLRYLNAFSDWMNVDNHPDFLVY